MDPVELAALEPDARREAVLRDIAGVLERAIGALPPDDELIESFADLASALRLICGPSRRHLWPMPSPTRPLLSPRPGQMTLLRSLPRPPDRQ